VLRSIGEEEEVLMITQLQKVLNASSKYVLILHQISLSSQNNQFVTRMLIDCSMTRTEWIVEGLQVQCIQGHTVLEKTHLAVQSL